MGQDEVGKATCGGNAGSGWRFNVMTKEFLEDLAITMLADAMRYSINTESRYEAIDVTETGFGLRDSRNVVGPGTGRDHPRADRAQLSRT